MRQQAFQDTGKHWHTFFRPRVTSAWLRNCLARRHGKHVTCPLETRVARPLHSIHACRVVLWHREQLRPSPSGAATMCRRLYRRFPCRSVVFSSSFDAALAAASSEDHGVVGGPSCLPPGCLPASGDAVPSSLYSLKICSVYGNIEHAGPARRKSMYRKALPKQRGTQQP